MGISMVILIEWILFLSQRAYEVFASNPASGLGCWELRGRWRQSKQSLVLPPFLPYLSTYPGWNTPASFCSGKHTWAVRSNSEVPWVAWSLLMLSPGFFPATLSNSALWLAWITHRKDPASWIPISVSSVTSLWSLATIRPFPFPSFLCLFYPGSKEAFPNNNPASPRTGNAPFLVPIVCCPFMLHAHRGSMTHSRAICRKTHRKPKIPASWKWI